MRHGSFRFYCFLAVFGVVAVVCVPSEAIVFRAAGDKRNVATFESQAPLETIVGKTSSVAARIEVDLNDIRTAKARFEVDLRDLDTGIDLRNEHMRGPQYLDTEKHPKAVFELLQVKSASSRKLKNEKPVELKLLGTFSVHGVTRKIGIFSATATYFKESTQTRMRLPGDLLHVTVRIFIRLSDFKIKRPKMILYRLSDSVEIRLDIFASTETPGIKEESEEQKEEKPEVPK